MKTCSKCNQTKNLNLFYRNKRNKDGLNYYCKECSNSINNDFRKNRYPLDKQKNRDNQKRWQQRHSKEVKDKKLKAKFNITIKDYNNMLTEQNYSCKICCIKQIDLTINLSVDHCHFTGKIRGLLCNSCNLALGLFKDNIEYLKNAQNYLKQQ